MAGYFAADGDVGSSGRPTIVSANRQHLDFVRLLCSRIGIGTFGVREHMRRGFGERLSAIYLVGIMRRDLDAAFFQIPEHRRRYLEGPDAAERRHWRILSVEETDRMEDVYCATVNGTQSFALEDNILVQDCPSQLNGTRTEFFTPLGERGRSAGSVAEEAVQ
jgi:hypothetical protein